MKPFLLLGIRADDAVADGEYESFLTFAGLRERDLRRIRLEQRPLGNIDLRDWSGIFLGGGPFNYSDPEESKSPVQRRAEADLRGLLDQVITAGFPFLGACYGIGALGTHQGAVVDRRYGEPVGSVPVTLTPEGRQDPLLRVLPGTFDAFVGHKEAVSRLPRHAVLLAGSPACPVQAFRIGAHAYATQFHPELDVPAQCTRIDAASTLTTEPGRLTSSRRRPVAAASPSRPPSCAGLPSAAPAAAARADAGAAAAGRRLPANQPRG